MLEGTFRFLDLFWASFLLLAPMLLLGLFLAGVIHVLVSRSAILRWLSGENLRSVCASAAVGVPVPLCSCSVVPVVREMRRKGASRSSCISFLITAPETGADSILVTHAFFGFVAAIVRPVASFVTAVVTGMLCIGLFRDERHDARHDDSHGEDHGHHGNECDHCGPDDHHHHHSHEPLMPGSNDCYVSPRQLKGMTVRGIRRIFRRGRRHQDGVPETDVPSLGKVVRHVFRYGFVEVADDILFALLGGIALGGLLYIAVPENLLSSEVARWLSYPAMVVVGIPLYVCASASTPVAAALVAKGLSPGAALILLMTGPATNAGTIAVVVRQFGARFGSIYVGGVIVTTTILGIAIDALLIATGLTLPVSLAPSDSPALQLLEWTGAFALIGLIAWRLGARILRTSVPALPASSSG